jgi:hypothetical protein
MRQWTEEDRKRQSELIRAYQPWKHSTGPKTAKGKYVSSKNATKHSMRSAFMASLHATMSDYRKVRRQLVARALLSCDILRHEKRHENKKSYERTEMISCLGSIAGDVEIFSEAVVFPLNCR